MFAEMYLIDGLQMEASLQSLKIAGCTYLLAIKRLSGDFYISQEALEEVTLYKHNIIALNNVIFCSC
jgi:hypothetical protein